MYQIEVRTDYAQEFHLISEVATFSDACDVTARLQTDRYEVRVRLNGQVVFTRDGIRYL